MLKQPALQVDFAGAGDVDDRVVSGIDGTTSIGRSRYRANHQNTVEG
jgi:hypothetical protein